MDRVTLAASHAKGKIRLSSIAFDFCTKWVKGFFLIIAVFKRPLK